MSNDFFEVLDLDQGLFLATRDAVFVYDPDQRMFMKVGFCDEDGHQLTAYGADDD